MGKNVNANSFEWGNGRWILRRKDNPEGKNQVWFRSKKNLFLLNILWGKFGVIVGREGKFFWRNKFSNFSAKGWELSGFWKVFLDFPIFS